MNNIFKTLDENYIKFENDIIHVIIDKHDVIWFLANDVAKALGYIDTRDAIKVHVDADNKLQKQYIKYNGTFSGHPQTLYINEGGLYSLILSSKMPNAKRFNKWVTNEVLPSIRKYGHYKMKEDVNNELIDLRNKLAYVESQYKKAKHEMKKEKFPQGGVVYVIDYTDNEANTYSIGMTGDMAKRKQLYDTHSIYKRKIAHMVETNCPIRLESCVKAMLYDYRIKDRKNFYECKLATIKKAFTKCVESIECMNQKGGSIDLHDMLVKMQAKEQRLQHKINMLDETIYNKN